MRAAGKLWVVVALLMGVWCASAQALTLQQVGSFDQPIYVTSDPSNPDRLFVVERAGRIVQVENGTRTVFADVGSRVAAAGEGGLLSIALSPDFQASGRLYVFYTGEEESPAEIHVAELVASGGTAPLSSLRNLITIPHPVHDNHYGGQLQIGPEGNLFISTGDGGGPGDPEENAQDLGSLLGKILRIDPDPVGLLPYGIPAGNPFVATPGAKAEIWSLGLRNPFRFSFDRQTGDVWIGDVGQDQREEVDSAAAPGVGGGANYGWNCREGSLVGTVTPEAGCASATNFVDPVFEYPNPDAGCAVIGGYVARGPELGDVFGRYVYADLCAGDVRSFLPADPFGTDRYEGVHFDPFSLNSFGQDSCGRLYAVSGDGPVYRLVGSAPGTCPTPITAQPPVALKPSFVGVRALRSQVKRNRRAFITAWVSPCNGRRGQPVSLWRGQRRIAVRRLDRVCSVRFRPRIRHRVAFRAKVKSDGTYAEAISRRLRIRILRRHRKRGKASVVASDRPARWTNSSPTTR
jgi:glucose/arabinose dehydrogenase